ncbi:MAG: hypothetical protein KJ767_04260, partial [Nanoarchaeota archaeon]|nr:hypothetical protein [Nanoarchaeota archaeon]
FNKRFLAYSFLVLVFLILCFVFIFPLTFPLTNAQPENYDENIAEAYAWLADKAPDNNWGSIEDNAFSIIALKDYDYDLAMDGLDNLMKRSKNNTYGQCWPATACNVKDTAIALLALDAMNANTKQTEKWLLAQRKESLNKNNWFIQFETQGAGECYVTYLYGQGVEKDPILVLEDRKVRISGTSVCLKVTKPYWLNIQYYCLDKEFYVGCEDSFIANLLFIDDTKNIFIPYPTVSEKDSLLQIKNKCFPYTGTSCDYISTLWATYALNKLGVDSETRAYLESGADTYNPKSLSYALIYLITDKQEFADKLADEQNPWNYWGETDTVFRTAWAYYALRNSGTSIADLEKAKSWILEKQKTDFSWNSKTRDTAVVLFSFFPLGEVEPEPEPTPEPTPDEFDFDFYVLPLSQTIKPGQEASYYVSSWLTNGQAETITFGFNGSSFPNNLGTYTFKPSSGLLTNTLSSIINITTNASVNGTFNLIVRVKNDITKYSTVELRIMGNVTTPINDDSNTQHCSSFSDSGFVCCTDSYIVTGASRYDPSCAPDFSKVCVEEADCLETAEAEDFCGFDLGFCCEEAASNSMRYWDLDDTCDFGEICASSCEIQGSTPPPSTCFEAKGQCCEKAGVWATKYSQLDCALGEVCASSCDTETQDCYDVGTCCVTPEDGALKYNEYDDSCSTGQVCASSCKEEKKTGSFLTFLLWFLLFLVVVGVAVWIYLMLQKRKKKKKQEFPTLPGLKPLPSKPPAQGMHGARPIPPFRPMQRPMPRPPMFNPNQRPIPKPMPIFKPIPKPIPKPLPTFKPIPKPTTPVKIPIIIQPEIKKTKTTKVREPYELIKTLKELRKIAKAKIPKTKKVSVKVKPIKAKTKTTPSKIKTTSKTKTPASKTTIKTTTTKTTIKTKPKKK